MIKFIFYFIIFWITVIGILKLYIYFKRQKSSKITIGFFHPFCNDGGGGERVLWIAVNALMQEFQDSIENIIIFSGNLPSNFSAQETVQEQFGKKLLKEPKFIRLKHRWLVEEETWPVARVLLQSLGSIALAIEALLLFNPDVMLDTHGYAFSYPIFKFFGGCEVGCYVHYPTMSTDMINKVNNPVKLFYYKLFHYVYGFMGSFSSSVMVNSSWTAGHIKSLWPQKDIEIVFPPCDTTDMKNFPFENRKNIILSIGQFRPEKDHQLQIKSFAKFLKNNPNFKNSIKLILCGSVRKGNLDDEKRLDDLKKLSENLNISSNVKFKENISYPKKLEYLKKSKVGIHTMWNEHFGIVLVEFMASGVIALGHKSGGPKMDIIQTDEKKGFLADNEEEYANKLELIFKKSNEERLTLQKNARDHCNTFSDENFSRLFVKNLFKLPKLKNLK